MPTLLALHCNCNNLSILVAQLTIPEPEVSVFLFPQKIAIANSSVPSMYFYPDSIQILS